MSTQDLPQRDRYRGITITNQEYTTPLSFFSTQEEGTKPSTKQRKKIQLGDSMTTNSLGDLNRPQIIFLTKQDPIDRFEMIAQVRENTKFF